ncbi:hypothetical protein [Flavobacterium soli]|uniref:hypothetical protein n=1 Tax=Flavobacterium soli TaxID=344881 RepID=UPI00047A8FF2|nr:hypothetical protein [Flavobacterium soli]
METKYKIEIPKPCSKSWEKMTPSENGRFCDTCMKNVVDFTNWNTSEIQHYLVENQVKKVCGRFNQKQLSTITIQIPKQILVSQVQFHKMFLLALLVTMGTTLLSCSDKNGDKQKIDKVEIVDDTTHPVTTMGLPLHPDTLEQNNQTLQNVTIDTAKLVAPTSVGKTKSVIKKQPKKPAEPIVLTGAVIVREKDSLK